MHTLSARLGAFVLLLASPMLSLQAMTIEDALTHYQNKNFPQAYQGFNELAKLGNPKAQMNIAVMHVRGEHVEKNLVSAYAWTLLAQDMGFDGADNTAKAIKSKLSRADLNQAEAVFQDLRKDYGLAALEQRFMPTNRSSETVKTPVKAIYIHSPKYPPKLSRQQLMGAVEIQFDVDSFGSPRHFTILSTPHIEFSRAATEAIKHSRFEPARSNGKNTVSLALAYRFVFYLDNRKVLINELEDFLKTARDKAIEGGSNEKLAYALQLNSLKSPLQPLDGAEQVEWDSSTTWYYKAAQDGSPVAKYLVGRNLLRGEQCDVAPEKSLLWLQLAADDNVLDAKLILGYEYLTGLRFKQDIPKGFELIEASAKRLDHAKIIYAWLLTTFTDAKYHDPVKAQALLDSVEYKTYSDPRSYHETEAAIALAQKNWQQAKKSIKHLHKLNKKYQQSSVYEDALTTALSNKTHYIAPSL